MELREKQLAMLKLLKRFDDICKKHNIQYCLAYGTAIGAVRHKGYIPWDDDLDIHMSVEDYKKLEKIWNTNYKDDESFFLQNYKTDKKYPMTIPKIRNTKIDVKEKYYENMGVIEGLWIDIFVVGYCSKKGIMRKMQDISYGVGNFLMHKYFYITKNEYVMKHHNNVKLKAFLFRLLPDIIRKAIIRILLRLSYNSRKKSDVKDLSQNLYFEENYFDQFIHVEFEDTRMLIPKEYDKYLTQFFGDYMTPVKYQHDFIE